MTARFRISIMTTALVGVAILGASRPAEATFQLQLVDITGGHIETIEDEVFSITQVPAFPFVVWTGDRAPGVPGKISAEQQVGTGNFTVSAIAQAPPLASQSLPVGTLTLTQSTFTITAGGAGTLLIYLAADSLNLPANAGYLVSSIGASISSGATSGANYSFQSFFDPDNNLGGTSGSNVSATAPQGPFFANLAEANVVRAPISPTSSGPFSVTNVLVFTATAAGQSLSVTGTTQVVAVPEPANIAMAGTAALLSLCAVRRRARA